MDHLARLAAAMVTSADKLLAGAAWRPEDPGLPDWSRWSRQWVTPTRPPLELVLGSNKEMVACLRSSPTLYSRRLVELLASHGHTQERRRVKRCISSLTLLWDQLFHLFCTDIEERRVEEQIGGVREQQGSGEEEKESGEGEKEIEKEEQKTGLDKESSTDVEADTSTGNGEKNRNTTSDNANGMEGIREHGKDVIHEDGETEAKEDVDKDSEPPEDMKREAREAKQEDRVEEMGEVVEEGAEGGSGRVLLTWRDPGLWPEVER